MIEGGRLPELSDLVELFDGDVCRIDPSIPWVYDDLILRRSRGDESVELQLQPASGYACIRWEVRGVQRLFVQLDWCCAIRVERLHGTEAVIFQVDSSESRSRLVMQLAPEFALVWEHAITAAS